MSKPLELSGKTFGQLTVIERGANSRNRQSRWVCKCSCGVVKLIAGHDLVSRHSVSCGCAKAARAVAMFTRHGQAYTGTYRTWCAMMARCHNPNTRVYLQYGARGIAVCDRWRKFENFYADMGDRPDGMTLDRINSELGYSPENCRWATSKEQRANTRTVRLLTLNGETMNVSEWAGRLGINPSTLAERLVRGWPLEIALTTGKSHKETSPMRKLWDLYI